MTAHLPLPAFHFQVSYSGLPGDKEMDGSFLSIAGIKTAIQLPEENTTVKKNVVQYNPVTLRRAVTTGRSSPLRKWILKSLSAKGTSAISQMTIVIMNEEHEPEITIYLTNVTAAGWELGELHAGKSDLLMEEIVLRYEGISVG
jgi:phage tail-like protein